MCFTEGMMSTTLLWCWLQWRWLHDIEKIEKMSLSRQLLIVLKLFQEQPGMQDLAKFCGRASLWGTVYALQFLQWWYQREHLLQPLRPHKAPPPPPQRFPYPESLPTTSARGAPKVVVLPEDRTICPLCHRPRQNPAMSCGGYAFCYTCLVPHVQEFGHCPVTGQRMRVEEIRRIRDEGWRGHIFVQCDQDEADRGRGWYHPPSDSCVRWISSCIHLKSGGPGVEHADLASVAQGKDWDVSQSRHQQLKRLRVLRAWQLGVRERMSECQQGLFDETQRLPMDSKYTYSTTRLGD